MSVSECEAERDGAEQEYARRARKVLFSDTASYLPLAGLIRAATRIHLLLVGTFWENVLNYSHIVV
jgi:hypothetical protein